MGVNSIVEALDLSSWQSKCPSGCIRDIPGCDVVGPCDLSRIQFVRDMMQRDCNLGPVIRTDVFVLGKGEGARRDVTKIGGTPYRPRGRPWPKGKDGKAATFVAQFRFVESRDLVPALPGDILLVFALDRAPEYWSDEAPSWSFEWYPIGLEDLVEPAAVPPPGWRFVTCYGVRCRVYDFLDPSAREAIRAWIAERVADELSDYEIDGIAAALFRLYAIKIGGVPAWRRVDDTDRDRRFVGSFLCSLSSIIPSPDMPYPWVNVEQPASVVDTISDDNSLMWTAGALINFALSTQGVTWHAQFWD